MAKHGYTYSAGKLVKHGLTRGDWPRMWSRPEARSSYDVVIIGGGLHGLATAYYLAKEHGVTNVAVVDKGYLGGGGSGRNTAIVRSNYLTPEGVAFYDRSLDLYNSMAQDLNLNVMFSRRGHLTLAHTDSALRTMHWRAEVNKLQGIDSSVIDRRSRSRHRASTSPRTRATRSWAPSTIRPVASSATTPSCGATPGQPTTSASTCSRRPRSPTSSARAAKAPTGRGQAAESQAYAPTGATSVRPPS